MHHQVASLYPSTEHIIPHEETYHEFIQPDPSHTLYSTALQLQEQQSQMNTQLLLLQQQQQLQQQLQQQQQQQNQKSTPQELTTTLAPDPVTISIFQIPQSKSPFKSKGLKGVGRGAKLKRGKGNSQIVCCLNQQQPSQEPQQQQQQQQQQQLQLQQVQQPASPDYTQYNYDYSGLPGLYQPPGVK